MGVTPISIAKLHFPEVIHCSFLEPRQLLIQVLVETVEKRLVLRSL